MNAFDRAMMHLDKAFGYISAPHQVGFESRRLGEGGGAQKVCILAPRQMRLGAEVGEQGGRFVMMHLDRAFGYISAPHQVRVHATLREQGEPVCVPQCTGMRRLATSRHPTRYQGRGAGRAESWGACRCATFCAGPGR